MAEPEVGWKERPDSELLLETYGYVSRIWVEQMDSRDQIGFVLRVFYYGESRNVHTLEEELKERKGWGTSHALPELAHEDRTINIFLDRGSSVAFAQLHLLRDAMHSYRHDTQPLLARVHFNFRDDTRTDCNAYQVRLVAGYDPETTVQTFDIPSGDWYGAARTSPRPTGVAPSPPSFGTRSATSRSSGSSRRTGVTASGSGCGSTTSRRGRVSGSRRTSPSSSTPTATPPSRSPSSSSSATRCVPSRVGTVNDYFGQDTGTWLVLRS